MQLFPMKILVLTPQLPYPPRQGTTIRNYNLIRALAQTHTVDLLTFLAPTDTLTADNPLYQFCRRIAALPQPIRPLTRRALDTLTSPLPDMALRLENAAMHELIQAWTQEETYDIVQVEGIEMAQYGVRVAGGRGQGARSREQGAGGKGPVLVFDEHNCEYLLQKRNALTDLRLPQRWLAAGYSLAQWQKLVYYERRLCRQADVVLAVSEADKAALQVLAPDTPMTVVSNGIHVNEYQRATSNATASSAAASNITAAPPTLVFTGKMDYRPNLDAVLWFGRQVLPLIQTQEPTVRFQIVGMNPHPRLDELRANPAIEITGAVPDAQTYIQAATVYIIPMRVGGGTRFKALEAMACGKAIVSTRLGIEGIDVAHERELLLADTAEDFAAAVLRLLRDGQQGGELTRRLGVAARSFVESHYDWAHITPRLEQAYQTALRRKQQANR